MGSILFPPWSWFPLVGVVVVLLFGLLAYLYLELAHAVTRWYVPAYYDFCPHCRLRTIYVRGAWLWFGRSRWVKINCGVCKHEGVVCRSSK
jgi:hypothetical protein